MSDTSTPLSAALEASPLTAIDRTLCTLLTRLGDELDAPPGEWKRVKRGRLAGITESAFHLAVSQAEMQCQAAGIAFATYAPVLTESRELFRVARAFTTVSAPPTLSTKDSSGVAATCTPLGYSAHLAASVASYEHLDDLTERVKRVVNQLCSFRAATLGTIAPAECLHLSTRSTELKALVQTETDTNQADTKKKKSRLSKADVAKIEKKVGEFIRSATAAATSAERNDRFKLVTIKALSDAIGIPTGTISENSKIWKTFVSERRNMLTNKSPSTKNRDRQIHPKTVELRKDDQAVDPADAVLDTEYLESLSGQGRANFDSLSPDDQQLLLSAYRDALDASDEEESKERQLKRRS